MGLAVCLIDDSDSIDEIRECLAANAPGVDFKLGSNVNKVDCESFGSYHNLHLLRGFAVYVEKEGRPPTEDERLADYPLLRTQYDGEFETRDFPHLIDHSDADGYYIPVHLSRPINKANGLSIGSVQGLLKELDKLRDPLWRGSDSHLEGPEVLWEIDDGDPFATEKRIWCQLRWLCRNAIKFNLVIVFG